MTSTRIGLWQIGKGQPKRLGHTEVNLEANLEDWIEQDSTLIRAGLTIVGRQLQTDGGPLDLLAIDYQNRWVVIEIKRKDVRRDTVTQVIDYASCIREMSEADLCGAVAAYLKKKGLGSLKEFKEAHPDAFDAEPNKREVEMIVVGTGRDSGLERIFNFLRSKSGLPVSIISFDVFQSASGEKILLRELAESDEMPQEQKPLLENKEKELCNNATKLGFGEVFASILKLANQYGLKKRVTNKSIMYAPPTDGRRCLFLVYGNALAKNGGIRFGISLPNLEEFYHIKRSRVADLLGLKVEKNGGFWQDLKTKENQEAFIRGLPELLKEILPPESPDKPI
jgi:Holliday junction resolvase-like predicted endonuclease